MKVYCDMTTADDKFANAVNWKQKGKKEKNAFCYEGKKHQKTTTVTASVPKRNIDELKATTNFRTLKAT